MGLGALAWGVFVERNRFTVRHEVVPILAPEARTLTITAHSSESGRLFGAISQAEVAEAAKAEGVTIDRRTVEFPAPIKTTGDHTALVRLHPEVSATVALQVVAG